MSRMKFVLAALLITAIVGVVPQAHAQTGVPQVILAGSSAMWQAMALAAYNSGHCVSGATAPCFHYTAKNFNLSDERPTVKGGATAVDLGNVWVVWDSSASPKVWAYSKVDSGVGDRCYFAQPHCTINISTFPAPGNLISSTLWGDSSADTAPPTSVSTLFTGGTPVSVNAAATDIRPEDALFATCRANSKLGGGVDGLAGLGYGANASGVCPAFGAALADLEGSDILSGYPASTSTAHILAWALSGKDPFTGTAIPAATTVSIGAAPIVFITSRTGALKTLTNVTDSELHLAFGGTTCNATAFGLPAGNIQVYLREPVSGTMNTTEYTVFRYKDFKGASQEKGVAAQNPLSGQCTGGARHRAIGTSEEVESVQNSNTNSGTDGIGYAFFSYGNVSAIADSANYSYLTLNGIDGIFHHYAPSPAIDPGQPTTAGELPSAADLPASCSHAFPCPENKIWNGNLSFPNLRSGSYRAWSVLRIVSNGAALTAANLLVASSQSYAVNVVPDYVPALRVAGNDPGLGLLRSHYTQEGVAPVNISLTGDKGGDAGGCILFSSGTVGTSDTTSKLAQEAPGDACVQVP